MNIHQYLRNTIEAQDKVFYHENCFATWDGNVNREVIAQGILDRLETMEQFEDMDLGISFARESLVAFRIDICDFKSEQVVETYHVRTLINSVIGMDDHFNYDERKILIEFFKYNDIRH